MLVENKNKYIWVLISLCGLVVGSVGLLNNCVGIFFSVVSKDLNILYGSFVFHNTLSALTMAISAVFVSKILTEKNFKAVLFIGVLLASGATVLMGLSNQLWQFYILGITRGIGMSAFALVVVSRVINKWYVKSNGTVTSVVFAFSGVGGAIFSPILSSIIESYGWRLGYIAMGVFVFVLALPGLLLNFTMNPITMNILPYGGMAENNNNVKNADAEKKITSTFIYVAIFSFGCHVTGSVMQHLSSIAIDKGYSLAVGSLVVSVSMIGNIASKFIIGAMADQIGVVKANIITIVMNMIAGVCLLFGSSYFLLMSGGFLYGFVYALTAVGLALITREVYGNEGYDQVYPIFALIGNGSFAIASTLVGYLYDFTMTYNYALIIGIILMVINIICVLLAKKSNVSKE